MNISVRVKNAVFWDVAPCRSYVNRCFGGTSVDTTFTRHHIPEDGILHSHRRENLKSYISVRVSHSNETTSIYIVKYSLNQKEKRGLDKLYKYKR
jgi:hypothetical protein